MISSAIERLTEIIEKRNGDEIKSFLSTEKGFRSEQFSKVCRSRVFIAAHHCIILSVSTSTMTCRYFTMWREESLRRRRKPMSGSAMRLRNKINTLKRNQRYEYVLDW